MRKYSRLEVSLAAGLVFTFVGLVLYGWFTNLTALGGRVDTLEDVTRDHGSMLARLTPLEATAPEVQATLAEHGRAIDRLQQQRKDDIRERKEAAQSEERRKWRQEFNGIFERFTEALATVVETVRTPPTTRPTGQ